MSDTRHVEPGSGEEAGAAHAGHGTTHPSPKEYVRIGLILGAITAFEVGIYYVRDKLGAWLIPILFAAGITKFAIVVLWFMHLKFDAKAYARFFLMGLALATTLYIVVLMTLKVFLR